MKPEIKNFLAVSAVVVLAVFAYAALSYVDSYAKSIQPSSFRSFSASGDGKVTMVPDVAQFTFTVITEGGQNLSDLLVSNTDKTNKALAYVKSQGVDAKDIKTANFSIEPRHEYYSCPREGGVCPPPSIVGYTVTQAVQVKVRDFNKTGTILAGVVTNGANSVSSLSFTVDDPTKPQNDARKEAITKAKEKAQAIADAAGFRLGRLLSINEGGQYTPYYDYSKAPLGMGGASNVTPDIQPGSQDVTVSVTLTYEIQ